MRIHDLDSDQSLKEIVIFLKPEEAQQMRDYVKLAIANPKAHYHVSSEDYSKEITICLYDPDDLTDFSERSKEIILEDR